MTRDKMAAWQTEQLREGSQLFVQGKAFFQPENPPAKPLQFDCEYSNKCTNQKFGNSIKLRYNSKIASFPLFAAAYIPVGIAITVDKKSA